MPKSTTLLLLTNRFPFGTGEEYLQQEMTYLAEAFDRVVVVPCMRANTGARRPLPSNVTTVEADLPDHRRKMLSMAVRGAQRLGSATRHVRHPVREVYEDYFVGRAHDVADALLDSVNVALRGSQPDVIYSYWFYLTAQIAGELRARGGWTSPLVSRAHGYDVNIHASPVRYLPQREHLLQQCAQVWPVSSAATEYLRTTYPSYADKVSERRLGTPSPEQTRVASQRALKIVTCSMIRPLKRLEVVQEAVEILSLRGHPVEWVHVGAGSGRYAQTLKDRARHSGQQRFVGYIENSEIFALYKRERPSVFLNVSSSEGVPVSVMEAMACGIPVIATDVGGTSELLGPLAASSIVPAGIDATALAASIEDAVIHCDPIDYAARCDASHARWREVAAAEVVYPQTTSELTNLCASH